jgi:drug/metabolite transporter (DMT)-like permease
MEMRRVGDAGLATAGLGRVLAAAAALGTLGPVAAVAYGEGVGPATFGALRAGIGVAILGSLLVARVAPAARLGRLPRQQRIVLAAAAAVNGMTNLLLFLAFGAMTVGLVMAVYYLYPALVALLDAVMGRERLTRVRAVALALACAGLALAVGSPLGLTEHTTTAGLALAGAAAISQAIYLVAIRGGFDDVPAVQATTVVLVGGLVVSGSAAFLLDEPGAPGHWLLAPAAWVAIACAGTVGALPKVWVMSGVRLAGSTRAAIALLTEPVVALAVAALALGERLTVAELGGAAAILVAVVLVRRSGESGTAATAAAGGRT